jgi:hypothetical protein
MLLRQHLDSKDEENLLLEVGSKNGVGKASAKGNECAVLIFLRT